MNAPPLTEIASPVMKRASSDTRKATTLPTSSGASRWPSGVSLIHICRTVSGSVSRNVASQASSRVCIGVATKPGQTQLTRMPWGASSNAMAWVRPRTANLLAT